MATFVQYFLTPQEHAVITIGISVPLPHPPDQYAIHQFIAISDLIPDGIEGSHEWTSTTQTSRVHL
jgi:hypothetical protein